MPARFRCLAVAAAALLLTACGGSDTPTNPTPPRPDTLPVTSVAFGVDVSRDARGHVYALTSLVDSVSGQGSGLHVGNSIVAKTVFALDASGDPLLAGTSRNGATELDARSTALTLIRIPLLALVSDTASEALDERIEQDTSFSLLVAAIRASSEEGRSYLEDDLVANVAAPLLADLLTSLDSPGSNLSSTRAPGPSSGNRALRQGSFSQSETLVAPAPGIPVEVEDGEMFDGGSYPTDLLVRNRAWIDFAASSEDATGAPLASAELPARTLDILSLTPSFGDPTETRLGGRNGVLRIRIGQSDATSTRNSRRAIQQVVMVALKAAGIAPSSTDFYTRVVTDLYTPSKISEIASAPDVGSSLLLVANVLVSNAPYIVKQAIQEELGREAVQSAAMLLLRQALLVVRVTQAATQFAEALLFYRDYFRYHTLDSEITLCQEDGGFVQCVDGVEVSPTSATIHPGESVSLTATLHVSAWPDYPAPRIRWSTISSIVSLSPTEGASSVATAQTTTGTASVKAEVGLEADHDLESADAAIVVDTLPTEVNMTGTWVGVQYECYGDSANEHWEITDDNGSLFVLSIKGSGPEAGDMRGTRTGNRFTLAGEGQELYNYTADGTVNDSTLDAVGHLLDYDPSNPCYTTHLVLKKQ